MDTNDLATEVGDDFVASITLNRPDRLNAFTTRLASELDQALRELDREQRARVIILKGAGKAFCAGIDVASSSIKRKPSTGNG